MIVLLLRGLPDAASPWRPRDGLRRAVDQLGRLASADAPVVVIGEPGVVYYLRQQGRAAWHVDRPADASRVVGPAGPYYLVGGIYARRVPEAESLRRWVAGHADVVAVGRIGVESVSDVRLLDDFPASRARALRAGLAGAYDLDLYMVER